VSVDVGHRIQTIRLVTRTVFVLVVRTQVIPVVLTGAVVEVQVLIATSIRDVNQVAGPQRTAHQPI